MVTVDEVVRLALPPSSRILAGESGLGRQVGWAARLRARQPAFEELRGDELAIVPLRVLEALDRKMSLKQVIHQLTQAGLPGIAVIGNPDATALADVTIPIIGLPEDTAPEAIEVAVQRVLLDRQADGYRQAQLFQRQFLDLALAGRGLAALVDRAVRLTGKGIVLQDADWQELCLLPARQARLPESVLREAVSETAPAARAWALQPATRQVEAPAGYLEIPERQLVRLIVPIVTGRRIGGYLSAIGEPTSFVGTDRLILSAGAVGCAIELAREQAATAAREGLDADLLGTLLRGDYPSEAAVLAQAERLGFRLDQPHLAVALCATLAQDDDQLLRAVDRASGEARPLRHLAGNRVIALIPLPETCQSPDDWLAFGQVLFRRVAAEPGLGPVSGGLGRVHRGLSGLRVATEEASQALTIGEHIYGPGQLTPFSRLGLYRFLLASRDAADLRAFYEEVLGPLLSYDQEHNSELVKTLEAYFTSLCSPQATAELLHLHRNSLLYRLQRIEEIAGLKLNDPETRLLLQLALRVRQVVGLVNNRRPVA